MGAIEDSLIARRHSYARWALRFSAVAFGLILLYSSWSARLLRPLADDYCQAAGAARGVLNASLALYQTFSGQLVRETIGYAVVGWPLVHVPFELASAIPFLLAAAALIAWAASALTVSAVETERTATVAVLAAVPALWWAFWWIPAVSSDSMDAAARADAITNWGTINSAYVINPAVVIITWIWILSRRNWTVWVRVIVCGIAGLVTGLSDYSLAVAVLTMGLALMLYSHLRGTRLAVGRAGFVSAYAFATVGLAVSYLAPGTRSRSLIFGQTPLPSKTPASLLVWTLPEGLSIWLTVVVSWGGLAVLLTTLALGSLARLTRPGVRAFQLAGLGVAMLTLSLVHALVARLAEAFSYPGFWHIIGPAASAFIGMVLLGFASGLALADWMMVNGILMSLITVAGFTAILAATSAVVSMSAAMAARNLQWSTGSASTWAQDLETDWVAGCWIDLGRSRALPDRGRTSADAVNEAR